MQVDSDSAPAPAAHGFVSHDPRFAEVLGDAARLVRVVDVDAHEGPVYVPGEDALYVTTVPRRTPSGDPLVGIRRLQLDGTRFPLEPERVSTIRPDANAANGMTLASDGHLLVCEQGTRSSPARVTRVARDGGDVRTVVDAHAGRRLNSPNDVTVAADGAVWFTDPSYGHLQGFRPEPEVRDAVYRYDPATEELTAASEAFDKPNGLAFSCDGQVLYVTDSGANQEAGSFHPERPHHVVALEVVDGRRLGDPRLFAVTESGHPDGIKVDADGRVYVSSFSGVDVFAADGARIGEIRLPHGAVNFTFGGPDRNVLFVTTDDAVWAAILAAAGATTPGGS